MSESVKNAKSVPSCLHCRACNSKLQYQEIFDKVGIEIDLAKLVAKYFRIIVKPDAKKPQQLCGECVNKLIRFFDIDEHQKKQDVQNAAKKIKIHKNAEIAIPVPPARPDAIKKDVAIPAKKRTAVSNSTQIHTKVLAAASKKQAKPTSASAAVVIVPSNDAVAKTSQESIGIRITRARNAPLRLPTKVKESITESGTPTFKTNAKLRLSKEVPQGDQEQISALIRDILDDEELPADDKFVEATATVCQPEKQPTEEQQQSKKPTVKEPQVLEEEEDNNELEFLVEREDNSSELGVRHFKVEQKIKRAKSQSQNESQSEDESFKVEPFNFVLIKESDNVGDLYEYLGTVVKTCFETLTFDWDTVCRHCSLKCSTYESLFSHMLKRHELSNEIYKCPIDECTTELQGVKSLAMHLVVLHAPVADIPIYGSCPECYMTFSNILQYNKHSCAHVIKKRRGIRLYCEMCGLEFPSWKRFNFHNQFHLERHRPRACFVCSYADTNIDDLFHHLHYAHEPEGTLFCDLCDRNFRDHAIFMEHNKSHSNVSSTTYTCTECSANFETRGRLNGHLRAAHGSVISCELCGREFASEATYNVHMKTHLIIEREVHVCNSCGLLSESNEKIVSHVSDDDSGCFGSDVLVEMMRDAYVCEYCSAYFKQKTDLRAHRDSGAHKNGLFWCQPCSKEFTDMKLYRHHLRNYQQMRTDIAHRNLEICLYYMCDFESCDEAYINWNSLYTHKRRTHDTVEKLEPKAKENDWICQFCQKVCRSKMSLSVHVARSHNNNNVVCPLCKASYKDDEALKKHHAYWHEPMECPLCLKVVKNRRNFDTHMNVVHSNNKRYSCSECQKGFYHKSEMEAHRRLHSESLKCDQCSFTTRNEKSLSVHVMGQHYKRFAFVCAQCDKRFGRRQGLSNHMQRVHGCKYICREHFDGGCSKSFASTTRLNVHVRKSHNGKLYLPEDQVKVVEKLTSDGPSTSRKRCIRLNANTHIEFIGDAAEGEDNESQTSSDVLDEYREIKEEAKNQPPKKKQKKSQ